MPMSEFSEEICTGLRTAFNAEAAAVQRYSYFAQTAEIEGQMHVARLFSELANSLACAAHGHLDFLRDATDAASDQAVGNTTLNLANAIAAELREATELYPNLANAALEAGLADVASWMTTLSALKKAQVAKLQEVLMDADAQGPAFPAEWNGPDHD
jgi:rubrerythrin